MTEAEFWRSTPFQTLNRIEAASERRLADYRVMMFGAWHSAYFHRVKKMPRFDDAVRGIDGKKRKPMSPDELLRAFEMINARSGGKDLRKTAH
jgi:hypothetical protein